ncbi:PREDICTED: U1 small nuclear ribonucleoprotein C-like [Priapulus caudatus]|uniref:U1 small nuclear ribonucleoprotein C n=1 Tax=Priapulus caudatus TaxID=37621 RepID=A0ABM1F463_PRICU|nr:PREDICTED: U1 small nuclear ribonucleoprotein C-like [Priapulus caudatus]
MPKYYCDYCDTYLTHDSPSVRKTHCSGRKHKDNVRDYYQNWMEEQAQSLIDATTKAFKAGRDHSYPGGGGGAGGGGGGGGGAMIPPPHGLGGAMPPRPPMMGAYPGGPHPGFMGGAPGGGRMAPPGMMMPGVQPGMMMMMPVRGPSHQR